MNDWLSNWTGNLSNVQAQASQALSSFFQPASSAPKSPVQAAEELAKSVQAAAKGTPAAPLVDPIATQAVTSAKQVEEASKRSYFEAALTSPAAKVAAGAAGLGLVWALVRRK